MSLEDERLDRIEDQLAALARILGLQQTREFNDIVAGSDPILKSLDSIGCSSLSTGGCTVSPSSK